MRAALHDARAALHHFALALLVLCVFTGSARAEHGRHGSAEQVMRLVEEWRYEEAQAEVDKLIAAAPNEATTIYLDAVMRFNHGDYEGAADRLASLADRNGHGGGRAPWQELSELVADTREATHGFAEARSPEGHFVIRYQPGRDELLLPYAFSALEAARREIGERDFQAGALLAEPIRVEIFPEVKDLAKVSTLTLKEIETSGTIAVCKFDKLMITSPRALVHGYPWLDTLAHEFTHFVITRVSRNTVPIWLHEGLAKYEERRWRVTPGQAGNAMGDAGLTPAMEHLLASALQKGKRLITFEEMSPSMAKLPSQEDTALAFSEVYTVIEYLLLKKGWEGVRALLAHMRDGDADSAAIAEVMGQPFDEFQRGWRAWLKGRKLRTHPGLVASPLKFAHAQKGKRPDKGADDDAEEVSEERARKWVRLGGLLRERSRFAAAANEYEKAQQLVGPGHPVVAVKLGRALLTLGDLDGAIAAATPAWQLYPDSGAACAILGEAWSKKGDGEKAAFYLEASLRTNPFDPAPHCALATLYGASADPRAARERKACSALAAE